MSADEQPSGLGIAVIGMAGRVPGADTLDTFWRHLVAGVESITHFSVEELRAAGVSEEALANPEYVRARGLLTRPELFDPACFGIGQREAALMDPQQRLFLETCWHALEDGAVDPQAFRGPIGVWGGLSTGMTNNTYLLSNLHGTGVLQPEDELATMLGNENDYLTTRVSYKLNLRGPSVNVQTACSTSLVAVVQACQALATWQCDAALAGGVSVSYPEKEGYVFQEGGIGSPDGHCRPFDAAAQGTVFSNGVGVVLLCRLEDALADRHRIYAVIRGYATNNDGAAKVSFAAPGLDGQTEVIATAHAVADVDPATIGFVEAHGTGTPLGDPIELAALTRAFRAGGATGVGVCALGSVKSNLGHLDSAAGVTGLIKTVLAVHHGQIPPTLHFTRPNPKCALETSPFFVNATAHPWPAIPGPRRAGVSSFGIGGTNAHIVLEQAPVEAPAATGDGPTLLVWSARSAPSVEAGTDALAAHLEHPGAALADLAHTLRVGRQALPHRRAAVVSSVADAVAVLRGRERGRLSADVTGFGSRAVAFLFPGGGTQYVGMGRGLADAVPTYREALDRALASLPTAAEVRAALMPSAEAEAGAAAALERPSIGLPALLATEYALSQVWASWGVRPTALLGHSMGEYTAACLAGVMSVDDAMGLVHLRGRLFETLPAGEMVGVPVSAADVRPHLDPALSIAAVNAASSCVVAGPREALAALVARLERDGVECRRLHIAVAAHSTMVEPILDEFGRYLRGLSLGAPAIPVVSNVTGTWLTADEARAPEYWVRHLRQTVRFHDGLATLYDEPNRVLLEVGPGTALTGFARQHAALTAAHAAQASMRHPRDAASDLATMLHAAGRLWTTGVALDWSALPDIAGARRVSAPLYAFERHACLIEPHSAAASPPSAGRRTDVPAAVASPVTPPVVPASHHVPAPSTGPPAPMTPPLAPSTNGEGARPRVDRIADRLVELLARMSGLAAADIDPAVSFLEMGFDSLFLTQASLKFKNEFKVKVTFRQLFEDAPTIRALATYVDGKMPADALPAPAATPAAAPTAPATATAAPVHAAPPMIASMPAVAIAAVPAVGANAVERVVHEQLRLMQEQLRLLGGLPVSLPLTGDTSQSSVSATAARVVEPVVAALAADTGRPGEATPAAAASGPALTSDQPMSFGPFKAVDKSVQGLTPHQQRHLDAFSERYIRKTAASKALTASGRATLADPRAISGFRKIWKELVYQIATDRSAASRMWDIDGNEYIDVTSGFGVNLFGYAVPEVTAALHAQLDKGIELGTLTTLAKDAATLLCGITRMERATFANTGSEALSGAIRAVRTATGRDYIAVFEDEYHGIAEEVLVKSVGPKGRHRSAPAAPGIPDHMVDKVIVLHYDDPGALDVLRERADEIAGVIIEPVQNRHPDFRPVEMIHAVRAVTAECDIPLIFDEMITGFRLHPRGAQGYFDVDVDIACYGKIMSGGLPIAAIAGKAKYLDAFDGGPWQFGDDSFPEGGVTFFGGTFTRNVLSLAASVAALRKLAGTTLVDYTALNAKSDRFAAEVNALFSKYRAPMRLEHCGSVCNILFTDDAPLPKLLTYFMRAAGIHIWDRPFFVSMIHTEAELAEIVRVVDASLAEMQAAHFLGGPAPDGPGPGDGEVVPFTDPQMEVWLSAELDPAASAAFNEVVAVQLDARLDVAALQRAVDDIVARHESLRMTTSVEPTGFIVQPRMAVPVTVHELTPGHDAEGRRRELLESYNREPMDLGRGPLVRVGVAREPARDLLVVAVHHLACDGWSFGVLLRELSTVYEAHARGVCPVLPPPSSAVAVARDAVERRGIDEARATAAYWADAFRTMPQPLTLPTDRPRPTRPSYAGGRFGVTFEGALLGQIRRFAAERRTTTFATMLAAYQVLLNELSGQVDFVVGTPMAGQSLLEDQQIVAHCVNFLPIRCHVDPTASFEAHLARVTRQVLDLNEHQDYTYLTLLRALRGAGREPREPLVAVSFTVEPTFADPTFGGLPATVLPVPRTTSKRDMHVNAMETPAGLLVEVDYNADIFDEATIARWMAAYRALLIAAIGTPDHPLSHLPPSDEDADRQRVAAWNDTARPYPQDRRLHQFAEQWATMRSESPAVVGDDVSLSWAALNRAANQLAHRLLALGVAANDRVAVCLPRSARSVVALLAVHKAGAVFVPLDPSHPDERLALVCDDAAITAVVTAGTSGRGLVGRRVAMVDLDAEAAALARLPADPPDRLVPADAVAYVIYTSGSTGRPKGVEVEHRHVVNYAFAILDRLALPEGASYAWVSTVAADLGLTAVLPPLASGGTIHAVPPALVLDGVALADYGRRHRIDVLKITPSHLAELVASTDGGDLLPRRCLVLGGEAARPSLLAEVRRRAPELAIVNHYGPTETTVGTLVWPVPEGDGHLDVVPLGRPLGNTRAYVLDDVLQPVAVGVTGEICIGGAGVARGYLHQPDLTAERFVPDPFSPELGARMYLTGDRGRWRTDGTIEFLGRRDGQVKVRGHRVELGDVEAAVRRLPSVTDAAVVLRDDGPSPRLVAYVLGTPPADPVWRESLRTMLPEPALPAALVRLERWPLTTNGKLDRAALPPSPTTSASAGTPVAATSTGAVLVRLWCQVLGVSSVADDGDFFALGGDSLLAIRLAHQIFQETGVRLPPLALFAYPSPVTLAPHVDALRAPVLRPAVTSLDTPRPPVPTSVPAPAPMPDVQVLSPELSRNVLSPVAAGALLARMASGGPGTPFFWVHGIGGEVYTYMRASRHLAVQRPVYGFAADWTVAFPDDHRNVESIAVRYVRELRAVRPHGPYHLGGYCSASMLQLEIARQLEAQGESVGAFVILDYGMEFEQGSSPLHKVVAFARNLPRWVQEDAVPSGGAELMGRIKSKVRKLTGGRGNGGHTGADIRDQIGFWRYPDEKVEMLRVHREVLHRYLPKPFGGRVTLLLPRTAPLLGPFPGISSYGWNEVAGGGVEIHVVPGSHSTFLGERFASNVAARLEESIRNAEARPSTVVAQRALA